MNDKGQFIIFEETGEENKPLEPQDSGIAQIDGEQDELNGKLNKNFDKLNDRTKLKILLKALRAEKEENRINNDKLNILKQEYITKS